MPVLSQSALSTILKMFGGCIPPEGPVAIPVILNFTPTNTIFEASALVLIQQQHKISYIQGLFIDNASNAAPIEIFVKTSQHRIVLPAYSQGFVALLAPNPPEITFTSVVGAPLNVVVELLNFPVSNEVWSTDPTFSNAPLTVTDPVLDNLLSNGYLPVLEQETANDTVIAKLVGTYTANGRRALAASAQVINVPTNTFARITGVTIGLSADAARAAPGAHEINLLQNATPFCIARAYVPGASVTTTPGGIILIDRPFDYWTTVAGEDVNITMDADLTAGEAWYSINYTFTSDPAP